MIPHCAILTSTEAPWLLRTTIERSELERELARLSGVAGFATFLLNGWKMKSVNGVFEQFAAVLEFPDYFGFNAAAFDECLTDLSWLNASGVCIAIVGAEQLLGNESGEIRWLLALLEDACKEWGVAVDKGEAWDRPGIPFHVLFQTDRDYLELLPPEIAALPSLEQLVGSKYQNDGHDSCDAPNS